VLLAAVGTWVVLTLSVSPLMARRLAVALARWVPDWLFPFAVVGVLSMVVIAAVMAVALVLFLVLVGRLIGDTLIPSMKALVAVPTGVAPWAGLGNDAVVLKVPCKGLETTGFAIDAKTRIEAVESAQQQVGTQLDDPVTKARLLSLLDGKRPQEEPPQLTPTVATQPVDPDRFTLIGVISVVVAATLIGWLAWIGISLVEEGELHTVVLTLLVGLIVGGAAILFLGGRAAARSHARSRFGVRPSDRHSARTSCSARLPASPCSWAERRSRKWRWTTRSPPRRWPPSSAPCSTTPTRTTTASPTPPTTSW